MFWFAAAGALIVIVMLAHRRKPRSKKTFSDNKEFFEWICTLSANPKSKMRPQFKTVIPALVDEITPKGVHLRMPSPEGGWITRIPVETAESMKIGDLVLWLPTGFNPMMADYCEDERQGWFGEIVGTIAPELDPKIGYTVLRKFEFPREA